MLDNFIDIHSHSLWGVDDGSQSFEQTIRMCSLASEQGTGTLFVTPHIMYWNKAENLLDERDSKVEYLTEALEENGSQLIIKKGFEILCDDEIFNIKYFKPYTLNESRYILIEFDFFKTSYDDVSAWCRYLKSFGLVPVIAHPERYAFVMNDTSVLDKLSENGMLFQINAGSPVGAFGEQEMNISCKMLEAGYVDFIGSDAHRVSLRNTDMLSFFEEYPYSISREELLKISALNATAIVNDTVFSPNRKKYMAEL